MNDKLDKLMDGLEALTGSVGDVSKRVDAIESSKRDDPDKPRDDAAVDDDDPRTKAAKLAEAQSRADAVSVLFGSQAPRPMDGEKVHAYRIRLARNFQHNSPDFKDVDLKTMASGPTFDAIESRIYADSTLSAATPHVAAGFLQEVKRRDASGRTISKFYGEPRTWMSHFMQEPAIVERINKGG